MHDGVRAPHDHAEVAAHAKVEQETAVQADAAVPRFEDAPVPTADLLAREGAAAETHGARRYILISNRQPEPEKLIQERVERGESEPGRQRTQEAGIGGLDGRG